MHNFVLVEHADIDISSGLTILTGETGAGKSLLLDALGAVLGDKTQPFWIGSGQNKTEVMASFDVTHLDAAQA
ncbi:MAG: AAA family ATPase [Agrobacterium sp.]|nr:AAA family ATPase [Agrobacterium sp.]